MNYLQATSCIDSEDISWFFSVNFVTIFSSYLWTTSVNIKQPHGGLFSCAHLICCVICLRNQVMHAVGYYMCRLYLVITIFYIGQLSYTQQCQVVPSFLGGFCGMKVFTSYWSGGLLVVYIISLFICFCFFSRNFLLLLTSGFTFYWW